MKLRIIAVGQRLPQWADTACNDYAKRFPPEWKVRVEAVKTEARGSKPLEKLLEAEQTRIETAIARGSPHTHVVALDEHGSRLSTRALALCLKNWQQSGSDVALLIGGPDGLAPALLQSAHERIRLSDLTLPHALVRVLLLEQLYRAWSINTGHPYHRE